MLKEVHDMAGQHEVIAENTQAQLIVDIQKCAGELKSERRKVRFRGQEKVLHILNGFNFILQA